MGPQHICKNGRKTDTNLISNYQNNAESGLFESEINVHTINLLFEGQSQIVKISICLFQILICFPYLFEYSYILYTCYL